MWVNDPGFLRLRQATRTVLAVIIALACFRAFGSLLALFAAFAAASFMQANSGTYRRQRQIVMLVTGAGTAILVFIAAICHGHNVASEMLMLAAAFLCFWMRRYIPDRNLFTLYSFTLALLANTFSGPWPSPLRIATAVFSGLVIAFIIYFFIWPPVFYRRFAAGVRTFDFVAGRCGDIVSAVLLSGGNESRLGKAIETLRASMAALGTLAATFKGSEAGKTAEAVVRLMRRVVVCFELLEENLHDIGDPQRRDLARALSALAGAFDHVRTAFLSEDFRSDQVLQSGPLEDTVVASFEDLPEQSRHAAAGAALMEASRYAERLEELHGKILSAMREPALKDAA